VGREEMEEMEECVTSSWWIQSIMPPPPTNLRSLNTMNFIEPVHVGSENKYSGDLWLLSLAM
jgi:hypothetical protein